MWEKSGVEMLAVCSGCGMRLSDAQLIPGCMHSTNAYTPRTCLQLPSVSSNSLPPESRTHSAALSDVQRFQVITVSIWVIEQLNRILLCVVFKTSCELLRRVLDECVRGSRCAAMRSFGESLLSNITSEPFCVCHISVCNSGMHNMDRREVFEKCGAENYASSFSRSNWFINAIQNVFCGQ